MRVCRQPSPSALVSGNLRPARTLCHVLGSARCDKSSAAASRRPCRSHAQRCLQLFRVWPEPNIAPGRASAAAGSAAGFAADDARPDTGLGHERLQRAARHRLRTLLGALSHQYTRLAGLSGKFFLMVLLFFLLAFVNTLLDNMKDTLILTAAGGAGAQVIPFLQVYAVLPCSLLFLLLYSVASQTLSRHALFQATLTCFMAFFALFALFLYPRHDDLHLNALADVMAKVLPSGLAGLVAMVRNWTFTVFFCVAELWGDVSLGLLFWGLANETTSLSDARTIYPLFGLGANVAQASAGFFLKVFSMSGAAASGDGHGGFGSQVGVLMLTVIACSSAAIALQNHIERVEVSRQRTRADARAAAVAARASATFPSTSGTAVSSIPAPPAPAPLSPAAAQQLAIDAKQNHDTLVSVQLDNLLLHENLLSVWEEEDAELPQAGVSGADAAVGSINRQGSSGMSYTSGGSSESGHASASIHDSSNISTHGSSSGSSSRVISTAHTAEGTEPASSSTREAPDHGNDTSASSSQQSATPAHDKPSMAEIFRTLAKSTPIQCLAVMSLAQGLCTNLMEFAWKMHVRLLFPAPHDFAAFLGTVSMWQGLVTGTLMVLSPAIFERFGWRGVASITPQVLLGCGSSFLATCAVYQLAFANSTAAAAAGTTHGMLGALVWGGAMTVIFARSARFSFLRPAEEMVYISLDEESRTKGKAMVGVVGTSLGKSGGSMLSQVLLLVSCGSVAHSLPVMLGVFMLMSSGWLRSVLALADHNPRYGHSDSVHFSLTLTTSEDEAETPPGVAAAPA